MNSRVVIKTHGKIKASELKRAVNTNDTTHSHSGICTSTYTKLYYWLLVSSFESAQDNGESNRMKATIFSICFLFICIVSSAKDMMRKSIVFDKNTPDVFYCPIHKPTGFDKLIVKARPLKKLCEFEGSPLPEDYKSDCYQDVDESDYACKEKYRIMKRLKKASADD
ncbi:hypothetical protein JTB14_006464 [Gonioctena quinquepunctata]|nr:hypothetical protein JTB14_006464 [Gonioctena quinquepunctata]